MPGAETRNAVRPWRATCTGSPAGYETQVYDNVAAWILAENGSTLMPPHHNLVTRDWQDEDVPGSPVFAGGADPVSYEGFFLVEMRFRGARFGATSAA